MKKFIFRFSLVVLPVVMGVSISLFFKYYEDLNLNGKMLLEAENDYRLKFVDSTNYELSLSGTEKVLLPVDILDVAEEDGAIKITTYENSVVMSPVSCTVKSVLPNGEVTLTSGNITCVISGILTGVKAGNALSCGDVLGTVKGEAFFVRVFWGSRKLSLDEIRSLL